MIPVTIIGGYLGAGKTTLINRLLAGDHGRRLAVLVNDFGAIDIDSALIDAHDGETISLSNGCVCCSTADALGDALDRVLALSPAPDQIVIEASGVADPAKIANYGLGWPGLRLDAVITVADGLHLRQRAEDKFVGHLVRQQLQVGDLILVSKTDLIETDARGELWAWIGKISPGTACFATADVDAISLLDVGISRETTDGSDVNHDDLFSSQSFTNDRPFDRARLLAVLDARPPEVWRVKGRVYLLDDPARPYLLQQVGSRRDLTPDGHWNEQLPGSRLVAIGLKGCFDDYAIRDQLESALMPMHPNLPVDDHRANIPVEFARG